MMDWLEGIGVALLVLGVILAAVEMMVPGFGVPGITAAVSLIAGIFCIADSVVEGIFVTLVVLVILGLMIAVILWLMAKGKLQSPLVLKEEQKKELGYISSSDLKYLLGRKGVAITDLRPTGAGDFDGVRFDVVTEGRYIDKGTALEIVRIKGLKLVVKEAE